MIKVYTIVTTILLIKYCILINDFKRCHHRLYIAKSRQCLLRPGNKTLLGLFTFAVSLSVASRRQEIDFHDITICLVAIEGGVTFHIFTKQKLRTNQLIENGGKSFYCILLPCLFM